MSVEGDVLALAAALRARGWRMASAESCTGGLVAAACTAVAGSSDWFEHGIVSYSNAAKTELLGVDATLIAQHGAVSEAVARAMAAGALHRARVQIAVAVTGIAGPGGAVPGKPVGTVWLAVAWSTTGDEGTGAGTGDAASVPQLTTELLQLQGDRAAVREQSVRAALRALLAAVGA